MFINISSYNRLFRLLIGILLIAWTVAGGPSWSLFGLYFLATGSWGSCPLHLLIAKLFQKETHIRKAVF